MERCHWVPIEGGLGTVEIMPRIERRRRWTAEEKAALLAEVEAVGGSVSAVARRHRISESVLYYNWRAALKAAATAVPTCEATAFIPLGVFGEAVHREPAMLAGPQPQGQQTKTNDGAVGVIEIALPNGARVSVDAFVNEKALSRVLRAMKGAT
jgi:transposase